MRLLAILFLFFTSSARAHDHWSDTSEEIKAWYKSLRQPDNPRMSCCGEGDAYWADSFEQSTRGEYVAIVTDERTDVPNRRQIKVGTKFVIPYNKMKIDAGNPTGHGIVFVNGVGQVLCYIVPGGG